MAWNISTGFKKGLLGKTAPYGSFAELLADGVIRIYSGSRPASADATETGTLLLTITKDGGAFTGGSATNGLNMGEFDGTTLKRSLDGGSPETWKGTGLADGTSGWCRFYANDYTTGASTTAVRCDGIVSVSGGELNMSNGTTITTGVDSEVTDVSFTATAV